MATAGRAHQYIAPITVPLVLSGLVNAVVGSLHKGTANAVQSFVLVCYANFKFAVAAVPAAGITTAVLAFALSSAARTSVPAPVSNSFKSSRLLQLLSHVLRLLVAAVEHINPDMVLLAGQCSG